MADDMTQAQIDKMMELIMAGIPPEKAAEEAKKTAITFEMGV